MWPPSLSLPEVLELGLLAPATSSKPRHPKAVRARWPLVELPVRVLYPTGTERVSHFRSARDPARIVLRILSTVATTRSSPGPT